MRTRLHSLVFRRLPGRPPTVMSYRIQGLALDNRMFTLDEMACLDEMLQGYLDGSMDQHR